MLGLVFPDSAEEDLGWDGKLSNDLVASCVKKNFCQKLLKPTNFSSSYNQ